MSRKKKDKNEKNTWDTYSYNTQLFTFFHFKNAHKVYFLNEFCMTTCNKPWLNKDLKMYFRLLFLQKRVHTYKTKFPSRLKTNVWKSWNERNVIPFTILKCQFIKYLNEIKRSKFKKIFYLKEMYDSNISTFLHISYFQHMQ